MRENYLSFHLREEHESRYCPLWCIWILFLFLLLLLWTIISPFFKFLLGRWLGSRRVFLSLLFSRLLKMVHKVSECKCIFNSRETKKKKKKKMLTSFSPPLSLPSEWSPPESSVGEPPSSLSATKSESYIDATILYGVGQEYQKANIKTYTDKFIRTQWYK